ncbi:hypothetical protein QOT17_003751 [Balamuthia mandrillaris]
MASRTPLLLLGVILALFCALGVEAQTFSLSIGPLFSNCAGKPGVSPAYAPPADARCTYSSDKSKVEWGIAQTAGQRSGLTFIPKTGISTAFETEIELGTLVHFNFPLKAPESDDTKYHPSNVDLELRITGAVRDLDGSFISSISFAPRFTLDIHETLNRPDTYAGYCPYRDTTNPGWRTDDLCCPYASRSAQGPCSDRLYFPDVSSESTFISGGVEYTLELTGFKDTSTGQTVTQFISDENQESRAVLLGKLVANCQDATKCPQPPATAVCAKRACSGGRCTFVLNTGYTCPSDPVHGACSTSTCKVGGDWTCESKPANQGASCSAPSIPKGFFESYADDCVAQRCGGGVCSWYFKGNVDCNTVTRGPSTYLEDPNQCQGSAKCVTSGANLGQCMLTNKTGTCSGTSNPCQSYSCSSGTCRTNVLDGNGCSLPAAQQGPCVYGQCVNKDGVGSCRRFNKAVNTGCTPSGSLGQCEKGVCNSEGVCTKTLNTGVSSCNDYTRNTAWSTECQQGTCEAITGGARCIPEKRSTSTNCNTLTGGATTYDTTCNRLRCNSEGQCRPVPRSSSCKPSGTTVGSCRKGSCVGGSCRYVSFGDRSPSPTCRGTNYDCFKYRCVAGGDGFGSCQRYYSGSGNCGTSTGWQTKECANVVCKSSDSVSSSVQPFTGPSGSASYCEYKKSKTSCGSFGSCRRGSCNGVTFECDPIPRNKACTDAPGLPHTCKRGSCNDGTCRTLTSNEGGSCSTDGVSPGQCEEAICQSGVCIERNKQSGSCDHVGDTSVCLKGSCISGSCELRNTNNNNDCSSERTPDQCHNARCSDGSCTFFAKTSGACSTTGSDEYCKKGSCISGNCQVRDQSDGSPCVGGTAAVECRKAVCQGGACTSQPDTSKESGSCTTPVSGLNGRDSSCVSLKCQSGSCKYVGFPAGKHCQTTRSGCYVTECNDAQKCVVKNMDGTPCGSPGDCFSLTCQGGYCTVKDLNEGKTCSSENPRPIPPDTAKRGVEAEPQQQMEEREFFVERNDRPQDKECYELKCEGGACTKYNFPANTTCGARPDPENFCLKYGCDGAGRCDDSTPISVGAGEPCVGTTEPCDFFLPTCYDECRELVCNADGRCISRNKEGECLYPKEVTFKRQDGGVDSLADNECAKGQCVVGLCQLVNVTDNVPCGRSVGSGDNDTDACANDYCLGGTCRKGERDCAAEVGEPYNLCWEVFCDAERGCGQKLNGEVHCSCISDCDTCTGVSSINGTYLSCWWCPGGGGNGLEAGCYDRENLVTGQTWPQPDDNCFYSPQCAAGKEDDGMTDEEVGGLVGGVVAALLAGGALLAGIIAAMVYFMSKTPEQDVVFGERDFEDAVMDNPFFENTGKFTESLFYEGN